GRRQGRWELLLARHLEARERDVLRGGGLAAVDQQQAAFVLDRPAVDRQRIRPGAWKEQGELAARTRAGKQEGTLDAPGSSPEGVDLHVRSDPGRRRVME